MEADAGISLNNNDVHYVIYLSPEDMSKIEEAIEAISNLQLEDQKPVLTITEDMIASVRNPNPGEQLIGTRKFRQLLSNQNPPIDAVINLGLVPVFVTFLRKGNVNLKLEAAWILTNIALGDADQTKVLIDAQAVRVLIKLLYRQDKELKETAIWALANIAGTDENFRNHIHSYGVMSPLLALLNKRNINMSTVKIGVWCLKNLCRGDNAPPCLKQITPLTQCLAHFLRYRDPEVIADICLTFSYICRWGDRFIQSVIDAEVEPLFTELLSHSSTAVVYSSLLAIGHIFLSDNINAVCFLNCTLNSLRNLLFAENEIIRRTACWTLSNMATGNHLHLQCIIDAGIIPKIVQIVCLHSTENKERYETLWVIRNAIYASTLEQLNYLIQVGCLVALCQCLLLSRMMIPEDIKLINLAISSLKKLLEIDTEELSSILNINWMVDTFKPKIDCLSYTNLEYNDEFLFVRKFLRNYQKR